MTLYRKNIVLSQELFAVIGCFEVTLRNKIDGHYLECHGRDWIVRSINGMFSDAKYSNTRKRIEEKLRTLGHEYSHDKLVAEMEFGFWRHLFAPPQFRAAGSSLLKILPNKPKSTPMVQYNHSFVFDELQKINNLRNRIAHHESICFTKGLSIIDTSYVRSVHENILKLFQWMNVDEKSLMHGLDHVLKVCDEIDKFRHHSPSTTTSPSSPSLSPYSFLPNEARR